MSHKKASKRRRETSGDDDFSPSFAPQKKRSRSRKEGTASLYYESPQQNASLDESESGVRRSSRTPKPKVFDDEEVAVIGKATDASKPGDPGFTQLVECSIPSTYFPPFTITSKNEGAVLKKQRKSATASFDEGHKRETRRSYQDYLKELQTETTSVKQTGDEYKEQTKRLTGQSSGSKNIVKNDTTKRKSGGFGDDGTPKGASVMLKTPKERGPSNLKVKRETPDEASLKVRSSSTTSLKIRWSSRAHVPKKSFLLLENNDDLKTKQATSEQTSFKVRTPKLQGNKRSYSEAQAESQQHQPKNTPVSEEPSPKVRVSSRGHIPKRTFSLLEGDEALGEIKGGGDASGNIQEDEKHLPGSSIEQQKGKVTNELKKQASPISSVLQVSYKQRSSREETKQASKCVSGQPDGLNLKSKVKSSEAPRHKSRSMGLDNASVNTPPSSSKSATRKSHSTSDHDKDGENHAKVYKHKSKPVKKRSASADHTSELHVLVARVKAEIEPEPELDSRSESSTTPKTAKPKSSSKVKQVIGSSRKQSPTGTKKAVASKQLSSENRYSFSLSEPSTEVGDSLEMSAASSRSDAKGNKKRKQGKNMEQKVEKGEGKVVKKTKKDSSSSVNEIPEQEHIILKLHLPQSEESTKHKKHHHHHHHHHHKHKHSSSNEDGSPKKSHHKKTMVTVTEDVAKPVGNQSTETKKKTRKISIKFKGLSSEKIDLEMAADSPGLMQSVELDATASNDVKSIKCSEELGKEKSTKQPKESSEVKSEKQSKEAIKKKKKSKPANTSSSQSESEHVKLVIKKDKLPSSSKSDEKKKKVSQPTTAQAKVGDQKKKTTSATASKKGKGPSTPAKTSSSSSVCLNLT